MKDRYLNIGRRWNEITSGQRKFVIVTSIFFNLLLSGVVYGSYSILPDEHQMLGVKQIAVAHIAIWAASLLALYIAAFYANKQ